MANGGERRETNSKSKARTQKKAKGFEKMLSLAGLIVSKPVRLRVAV